MPRKLPAPVLRAVEQIKELTLGQRILAVLGIGILIVGVLALNTWASQSSYSPLFTNLTAEDASAIVDELSAQGVPYEIADAGQSIMVPAEDVYRMRLAIAAAGLPSGPRTGYSLLDEGGVTTSDFQQQVTYRRAIEGELAASVKSISGVETATVHLALPERSVFADKDQTPTASVLVSMRRGSVLTPSQIQAVVHLVASSVERMDPADVTVVDADGNLLSTSGVIGAQGMQQQLTSEYEVKTASAIQTMLDRVVGPGKAVATVVAELDRDIVQRVSETFTSTDGVPPLSSSSSVEEYTGNGTAVGGVLGVEPGAVTGNDSDNSYRKETQVDNNAVNKITEHLEQQPGALRRQSVSVIVDQVAAATLDMTQLTSSVAAAAGIDTDRGDVVTVTRLPFDTSFADAAKAELEEVAAEEARAAEAERNRIYIIAGVLALLIIIGLIARHRRARASRETVDLGELEVLNEPVPAIEGEDDEGLLITGPAPMLVTDPAAARLDEVVAIAEDDPEEIAEALRSWLAERRV